MSTRPDTPAALEDDARVLHEASRILRERWITHKYDQTAARVRAASVELISRSRHPSRQPPQLKAVDDEEEK